MNCHVSQLSGTKPIGDNDLVDNHNSNERIEHFDFASFQSSCQYGKKV